MPIVLQQPDSEPTSENDKRNRVREEYPLSFAEAAAFLRELADAQEKGSRIEMGLSQQKIQLSTDEPVTLEIFSPV